MATNAQDRQVVSSSAPQGGDGSLLILPAGTVDQATEAFEAYQQLKHRLAGPEDFQLIRGKQFPKKSFVRKVQRFFAISCELRRDEPIRDAGGAIIGWIATARAIHLPTGAFQDADGSCSFDEKENRQRTLHNVRSHAVTRAKNRAILDLVGFGDISAEEAASDDGYEERGDRYASDDGSPVPPNPSPRQAQADSSQPRQSQSTGSTEAQQKAIYARAKALGVADELSEVLRRRFGVSDTRALTRQQASALIDDLGRIARGDLSRSGLAVPPEE